ncbi:MAG: glycosyltransferase family 39 protein [Bacteroidales bacterium]|nr:glycosyltransferase family 39 protein [Bacteroidales bacterium]MCF8334231.1 glycosyltransferase family 39 protein [Bacteroidales bacterium]
MNKLKTYLPLAIILVVASFVRFYHYDTWSLSNDELSALSRLNFDSFSQLIREGVKVDGHPAGVQVFLFYWTQLFGLSATAVRLPFVLMGIFSVLLGYLIARRWFGKTPAFYAGMAMALLEFSVLYSQIARPYISGLFLVLLTVYFWDSLVFREKPKWTYSLLTGLGYALAMYNHYFSFLTVLVLGVTGLFYVRKNRLWPYLLAGFIAVVLFLPHLPVTLFHLSVGGVGGWLEQPSAVWIFNHLVYVFNESRFLLFVSIAIVAATLIHSNEVPRWTKYHTISSVLFLTVFVIGFGYSLFINPVLQHSTMIFVFPFFLFMVFSWIKSNKVSHYLIYVFTAFLVIPPDGIAAFYKEQHFGEFKGVAQHFRQWNKEYEDDEVANILVVNDPYYINYYFDDSPVKFDKILNGEKGELDDLSDFLAQTSKSRVCFAWTKPFNPQLYDIIRGYFPLVAEDKNYGDLSRITLFSEDEGQIYDSVFRKGVPADVLVYEDFSDKSTDLGNNEGNLSDTLGRKVYRMEKDQKYDLEFTGNYEFGRQGIKEIEIKGKLYSDRPLSNAMWVVSIFDEDDQQVFWKGVSLKHFSKKLGKWQEVVFTPETYKLNSANYLLKVYIWNRKGESFLVDKLSVSAYGY